MEALMSHILQSAARQKRPADDYPLDLSRNKYTRHTCDRLVDQEDLRPLTDSNNTDYPTRGKNNVWYPWQQPGVNALRGSCDSDSSSICSDDSIYIKQEAESPVSSPTPHPFSITALLGDNSQSDTASVPAVVFSAYSKSVVNPAFVMDNSKLCESADACTNSGFHTSLSAVKSSASFWCHVCNALCIDYKDAQGHQYQHYMMGARCNLRKLMLFEHGFVTKHVKLDDEKMKCGLCDKIVAHCFFTKHQRLHDGHFCDICGQEFSTNSRMQDHMNIHTGNTPFACTICDRKFAKRSSLTQHQRYHRNHQCFSCSYCPKSFNSKYACAVHERLHTGDNPFRCLVPGCTRAFPQKIQLQLHRHSH